MSNHYIVPDSDFISQFKNATLDPKYFDHEAHLRLAWLHIANYGLDIAIDNICTQIKAYAISLGASDKYNKTVTVAAVKAVYHFMLKSDTTNFKDFISENIRLKTHFKDLLTQHYNIDIFNSEVARSSFLEPDILPFD